MASLLSRTASGLRGLSAISRSGPAAATAASRHASSHTFQVTEAKAHKLDTLPATEVTVTSDELQDMLHQMATIRRIETSAGDAYREKKIRGFLHLYSGQEAIAVGVNAALREMDTVVTAYRCHGWAYCSGVSSEGILAELFGNAAGCSNGKGGSMHMYGKNFYGGNGIVGAQVPIAAGLGLAHQYKGDGGVAFGFYGDGASNQGQVFEAYNIAKLWNLPVVFVCENNKYGMGTHDHRSSASTEYYKRGDYVPGLWVDGMDALAVKAATEFALDYCPQHGPLVMEMETYRYHGHSMSDPDTTYRTRDEIKDMRETNDPIILQKSRMKEAGLATDEEFKAMEKTIRSDVKKAAASALASGDPSMDQLTLHILKDEIPQNIRGCDPFTTYNQA